MILIILILLIVFSGLWKLFHNFFDGKEMFFFKNSETNETVFYEAYTLNDAWEQLRNEYHIEDLYAWELLNYN